MYRPRQWVSFALALSLLAACSSSPEARRQKFLANGDRYFAQGKYAEARVEFRNAVQADGTSGDARLKLAAASERVGDLPAALAEYVRAADLLPKDLAVQLKAGEYLLAARQFDDARARAEAVLAQNPRSVDAQVLLGNALAGLKNLDDAVKEMEEAVHLDPTRGATYANLGQIESIRGRKAAAEEAFQRAIALDPKWVPGHLALANHYWASGRVEQAEQSLRQALALEPDHAIANRALALLYLSQHQPAKAEPYVRKLAATKAAPFALVDFYQLENQADSAVTELERLRKDQRTANEANQRLAATYAAQGKFDAAMPLADALLSKDPRNPQFLLLKGSLLAQAGKRDEALDVLQTAAGIDANSAPLQLALGKLYQARGDIERARQAYREAQRLNPRIVAAQVALANLDLREGRVDSSVQMARDAVKQEPRSIDAQISLIRGLIASRDLSGAEVRIDALLKAQPESAIVHVARAWLFAARGDQARARSSLEHALTLDPNSTPALDGLVASDLAARDHNAARARLKPYVSSSDPRVEWLLLAARVEMAAKTLGEAERLLRLALARDPSALAAYGLLGQVYFASGRLADARREFETLATRQPQPVVPLTILGMLATAQSDSIAAAGYFGRALEIDPKAPVAANNLAWIYAERGERLDDAQRLAETAARALPKSSEVQDTLGWVHYKRQAPAEAVAALTAAVRLAPSNATYHYHLGLALKMGGDTARARDAFERALTLDPAFAGAADARRELAALRSTDNRPKP